MLQFSQRSNFIKMLGSRICQRLKTTTAHARAVCKSGVVIPLATAAACVAFSASNPTQMKVAAKKSRTRSSLRVFVVAMATSSL